MTEEENIRLDGLMKDHLRRVDLDTGDPDLTLSVLVGALILYIAGQRVQNDSDLLPDILTALGFGVNDLERQMRGQMKQ
jgi:hypothetical protein